MFGKLRLHQKAIHNAYILSGTGEVHVSKYVKNKDKVLVIFEFNYELYLTFSESIQKEDLKTVMYESNNLFKILFQI